MIDESKLAYAKWSTETKVRVLKDMDKYIYEHCEPADYLAPWGKYAFRAHGKPEEEVNKLATECAQDDTRFVNALFAFQCCLVTDMSWAEGIVKAAKKNK